MHANLVLLANCLSIWQDPACSLVWIFSKKFLGVSNTFPLRKGCYAGSHHSYITRPTDALKTSVPAGSEAVSMSNSG